VTCLFVASKIEETIKKLKDILVAVHSVKYPDTKELDHEQISEERKRKIISYEKMLLETVCFDFQLRHPFEYVIKFIKWIQGMLYTYFMQIYSKYIYSISRVFG
jgi:CTD kinase subunit beta